jgi:hypothetical protein
MVLLARHFFLAKFPEIEKSRMLLFLGRIYPKKGCDLAIDALPRRASGEAVLLVIAGPDQVGWTHQLGERVARMDVSPRVTFAGMLEGPLKRGALENADAFILPSHQENFGMSVIEALSFGVPVLISDRVNIWREIAADHAGFVEPDDLAGTTRLIERWLHTPPGGTKSNAGECTQLLPPSVRNQPGCRVAACDFASAMKITILLGAFLPVPSVMGGAIEKSWLALAQDFFPVTMMSPSSPAHFHNSPGTKSSMASAIFACAASIRRAHCSG